MNRFKLALAMVLSLAIALNLNVGLHSMTAKADTIEENITIVVKVLDHQSKGIEKTEVELCRYEDSEWKKVAVSKSDESGIVSFDLASEANVNSYFKLNVSKAPTGYLMPEDAAVYVFVSNSGVVSYSKTFSAETNSLGDGATGKIKSFRLAAE